MSRKVLFILLIPAVLLIGGYLYLRLALPGSIRHDEANTGKIERVDNLGGKKTAVTDLRPLFVERMQQLLKKISGGLYHLSVGDMQLDVLASTVSLQDVSVTTDSGKLQELKTAGLLPANVFNFQFKKLVIEGINLDDALTRKTMDYKLVKLVEPVIHVYRNKKSSEGEKDQEDISQRLLQEMTSLKIQRLEVDGGTLVAHGAKNKINKLNEVQIRLTNILLDSATRTDKQRFLFAQNATIGFRNYTSQTSDGLYQFKIGRGTATSPQQQVVLQDISFSSPLSRQQFMARQKICQRAIPAFAVINYLK